MDSSPWLTCVSPHTIDGVGTDVHTYEVRAILDGATEPVPDGFVWQAIDTDFTLFEPR